MLTKLRIRNFKAWKDSGEIRLAPLTVLFGTNSAGKTSIPQLLLLLKQTAEAPDRRRALHLGDSRTVVDAGTFDDVVHHHDVRRPLEFELQWQLPERVVVRDPFSEQTIGGDELGFVARLRADERHQPIVEVFEYRLVDGGSSPLAIGLHRRRDGTYDLKARGYRPVRQQGRAGPLPPPIRFYGFPDETSASYRNVAFASDLVLQIERLLRGIYYLGPLRESPKRLYLWSGETPEHVGERGDRAIEAILAASDRRFSLGAGQRRKPLASLVADRLKEMGLIQDFRIESLGGHRKEFEVLVRTAPRLPFVRLTDVGFGVSQVLPLIVELFYVPPRSIVIFEQPEIHLHPKVQANLADLFVDAIRARENGVERHCQFIIESHSEHFLRRLQRRIAEEKLSNEEAALYFVRGEQANASLHELDVDAFGNIRNWPEDFFGDDMADLVARSEAQARRARREAASK